MKALTFTIELLEPMLATGTEGDPNAGVSQKFVAGSVLRGTIIGLYLRSHNKNEFDFSNIEDESSKKERNLFFNETVCYLNAYPKVKINSTETKRGLPVPLSWQKVKDAKDEAEFSDFCFAERKEDEQYKDIGKPFFVFDNSSRIFNFAPETRLAVHTQRDAKKGRSTSDDGAVFRYESVTKGTKFGGAILSNDEKLLGDIKDLIDGKKVLLGGSRTAGYGRARIICEKPIKEICSERCGETSREIKEIVEEINDKKEFTVTLLSNALIRDENGQLQTDLTADFLGINAALCEKKTFKRAELVGGFNRKWGLPLPQQLSIKAGSVFKFTTKQTVDEDTIKNWLSDGIGERRLDGFGRIAINLNHEEQLHFANSEPEKITEEDAKLAGNANAEALAQKMNERILRQKFETKLVAEVGSTVIRKKISNSQISRLRLLVREVLRSEKTVKDIIGERNTPEGKFEGGFFNGLKKPARDQFDAAKIGNDKLPRWIENILEKQDKIKISNSETPKIGGISSDETNFKLEYHLRLIDGVLARTAKENN